MFQKEPQDCNTDNAKEGGYDCYSRKRLRGRRMEIRTKEKSGVIQEVLRDQSWILRYLKLNTELQIRPKYN